MKFTHAGFSMLTLLLLSPIIICASAYDTKKEHVCRLDTNGWMLLGRKKENGHCKGCYMLPGALIKGDWIKKVISTTHTKNQTTLVQKKK